jgi:tetratricopeptide (TPR) repeat protein
MQRWQASTLLGIRIWPIAAVWSEIVVSRTKLLLQAMKTEIVTDQILGLVKNYCAPNVVTGLMNDLRRSEALDQTVLRDESAGPAQGRRRRISLGDQDKLDRLITLCHDRLATKEVCQVMLGIGDVFKVHGETTRAEELYTMALAQGAKWGEKECIAEAHMRRGEIYSRKAQWKQSTADLGRSRVIYSEMKHYGALGRVENILGTNFAEQGRIKTAVECFTRALALFERTHQTQMAGVALMNLGITYNIIGNFDSAVVHYKRAQSCFEEVGDFNRLAELHHNMGMTYLSKRMFKEAIREFNASYAMSSSLQNGSLMGLASLGKANAYHNLYDLPVALKLVSQAIEFFTKSGERVSLADAYKVKGMIHRDMKSFDTAASYLQTSLRINTEINNQLNAGESYFEIGILETSRKKKEEALQAFRNARTAFKKVGAQGDMKKTQDRINALEGKTR